MSEVVIAPRADRSRFSLHEEEDVVEVPAHRRQVFYLENNLRAELPDRFVGANMGVYWVQGQFEHPWVGPDVFVAGQRPADASPRVYLVWEDGPIQFVGEVASERTRRSERPKRETYYRVDLQIPEYLYVDLDRHLLELWRLQSGVYQPVSEQGGRLHSQQFDLWFGWDPAREFVRIWTADGRLLPTVEEVQEQAEQAELRAQSAELRAQSAELHAEEVREQREQAESRAHAAEQRIAELTVELERLRAAGDQGTEVTP
jgi:Uma2 family endonuclease